VAAGDVTVDLGPAQLLTDNADAPPAITGTTDQASQYPALDKQTGGWFSVVAGMLKPSTAVAAEKQAEAVEAGAGSLSTVDQLASIPAQISADFATAQALLDHAAQQAADAANSTLKTVKVVAIVVGSMLALALVVVGVHEGRKLLEDFK
jgi:hypothetical protein